jgi:hypothetical protein
MSTEDGSAQPLASGAPGSTLTHGRKEGEKEK